MSHDIRKPFLVFPNRSDINRPVYIQQMARGLKFLIKEEKNFAKSRLPHDAAQNST